MACTEPPLVADEPTALVGWLDYHRATLLWKCAGPTAGQLVARPIQSSSLWLLGLVRHMAEVGGLVPAPVQWPLGPRLDLLQQRFP